MSDSDIDDQNTPLSALIAAERGQELSSEETANEETSSVLSTDDMMTLAG